VHKGTSIYENGKKGPTKKPRLTAASRPEEEVMQWDSLALHLPS